MKKLFTMFFCSILVCSFMYAGSNAPTKTRTTRILEPLTAARVQPGPVANTPFSTLSESFDGVTFPPQGWVELFPKGGGGGWSRELIGGDIPGWTGGVITAPPVPGTNTALAYITYDTVNSFNDFWLVTPKITGVQAGDTLSFWLRKLTKVYSDTLEIRISTTTATSAAFTTVLAVKGFAPNQDSLGWTKLSYSIGSVVPAGSDIYIAFREKVNDNVNNGAAFFLDLVSYSNGTSVPVELTAFTAKNVNGKIVLNWATATETNNKGFEIQKQNSDGTFTTVAFIAGQGTSTNKHEYSYSDNAVVNGSYSYRLKQVDYDGSFDYSSTVNVDVNNVTPSNFALEQNYPNPFNPSTVINFSLAADSKVSLKVYNVLGQPVANLVDGNMSAGFHAVTFNASQLTSGMYMYKLEAKAMNGASFVNTRKMILNK